MRNDVWLTANCEAGACVEVQQVGSLAVLPDDGFASYCNSESCVEVKVVDPVDNCNGGACVEVQQSPISGQVLVRDSKDRTGPILVFDTEEWRTFVTGVKAGMFDV